MMRDHVVERTFARARDAYGNAHRSTTVRARTASAGATSADHNHVTQGNIASAMGKKPLVKSACQKMGAAVLSLMLALTMMPSAGIAFATEDSLGGVQRSILLR